MKIIEAQCVEIETVEGKVTIYSRPSLQPLFDGYQVVTVMAPSGIEITAVAHTRGEALVEMADRFQVLARHLRKFALEVDGAIRLGFQPKTTGGSDGA